MSLPLVMAREVDAVPDVTVTVPRYDVAESWATVVLVPPPPPGGGSASAAGEPVAARMVVQSVMALSPAAVRRRVWVTVMRRSLRWMGSGYGTSTDALDVPLKGPSRPAHLGIAIQTPRHQVLQCSFGHGIGWAHPRDHHAGASLLMALAVRSRPGA